MNRKKWMAMALIAAMSLTVMTGCGKKEESAPKAGAELSGKITASGSTALLPLLKPAAEEFQKLHPKVTVNVSGGGSFTGQNQVATGAVNIGNSDVPVANELKDKGLKEFPCVVAPFVFIVNKDVTVDNLSQQQYTDIMTGKIKNWKEVGGADEKITIIHRAKSSGSRATIEAVVLKGASFTDDAIIQDSNGAVRSAIVSTPGSIGYVDSPYADDSVKVLKYNGVEYKAENVLNKTYPVYATPRMITKGDPDPATKAFIDFVLSKEFQEKYAVENKFIPITQMSK